MNRPISSSILRAFATLAVACLAGWSLLSFPAPALADDSSVGGIGGDIYPLANTDIRMESETVQAIVYRHYAEYRVDFRFVNAGPAQTLMLGFPFALDDPERSGAGPVAFRAWQDGTPLPVTLGQGRPDGSSQGYYLHQATFPPGSTMITVSYLSSPSWTSSDRYPELTPAELQVPGVQGLAGRYDYWLHTGAGWAGTIGTAVVRYTLADDFRGWGLDVRSDYEGVSEGWPYITRPETYTRPDERTYQWVFKELEPTEDDDIVLALTGAMTSYWEQPEALSPALGAIAFLATISDPQSPYLSAGWGAIDGDPGTALSLPGNGGGITLNIRGDQKLKEIRIVPGKNDTPESFTEYGRPKTIKVTLSDGTSTVITLADEPSLQKFPISGLAEWVRLDVLDTYPGSKSTETYFSDISFGNRAAPAFEPFSALIAEASPLTTPSSSPPLSSSTSLSSVTPSTEVTGLEASGTRSDWTVWPIVALAIAGAALVTAIVLTLILLNRRSTQKG